MMDHTKNLNILMELLMEIAMNMIQMEYLKIIIWFRNKFFHKNKKFK